MTQVDTTDLTPRPPREGRRATRRWIAGAVGLAVAVAVVVLVWNLLSGTLFFYDADEAVERRAELGDERFTLQGAPIGCSIVEGFDGETPVVAFSVAFGGVAVDIVHTGDPAELFQAGVPVVLDGAWVASSPSVAGFDGIADDGWYFASDRMRVKHDEISNKERPAESDVDAALAREACGA